MLYVYVLKNYNSRVTFRSNADRDLSNHIHAHLRNMQFIYYYEKLGIVMKN